MTTLSLSFHPETQRHKLDLLLATVFLVVLPHVGNLAPSILAFFALMVSWCFAAGRGLVRLPNRSLLFVLTAGGAGLVFAQYRRFYGMEGGSSLFVVGLGLKLLELRSERDAYLVVFLAFFVAVTQYLFSQSIPMAAYTLAIVVLLVAVLVGFNGGEAFLPRQRFKLAAVMTGQAIPLMIVLFVFFPRVQGPLWQLPDDGRKAKTGLSDTLEPGSITQLGLSQEPAFRVDFEGPVPPPRLRYWRGPVFWRTDGQRWDLPPTSPIPKGSAPRFTGPSYVYTLTLEPHNQHWVIALDLPSAFPGDLTETADYVLLSKDRVGDRRQYRLISRTEFRTETLSDADRRRGLQVPSHTSDRVRRLALSWTGAGISSRQTVQQALRHFHDLAFFYTLTPPATGADPVDGFLFESRRGFCEHYATSFVMLMRLAGIPSRVVTGYQGGTWNPLGKFLEVKQADAHAWAEVWLDETGWTRVDPTAAVAPERIERGLDVENQVATGEIQFNLPDGMAATGGLTLYRLMGEARQMWASIDHAWNWWVLSYGPENQTRLMERLGVIDWRGLLRWLAGSLGIASALAAWWILPRRMRTEDPVAAAYRRFLKRMAKQGYVKQPGEGPKEFAERIGASAPEWKAAVDRVTRLYVRLRYERRSGANDRIALQRAVRQLGPQSLDAANH
jgi:transglutaminase-like putative cysteine protease